MYNIIMITEITNNHSLLTSDENKDKQITILQLFGIFILLIFIIFMAIKHHATYIEATIIHGNVKIKLITPESDILYYIISTKLVICIEPHFKEIISDSKDEEQNEKIVNDQKKNKQDKNIEISLTIKNDRNFYKLHKNLITIIKNPENSQEQEYHNIKKDNKNIIIQSINKRSIFYQFINCRCSEKIKTKMQDEKNRYKNNPASQAIIQDAINTLQTDGIIHNENPKEEQ
jgi:hypothetical protein